MAALTVTDWVSMSTAVIGTVVAVLTLALQLRERRAEGRVQRAADELGDVDRWERDEVSRAANWSEARDARAEASRRRSEAQQSYDAVRATLPVRRRRSYKAIAATILGALSLFGALSLMGAAQLTGEPVTAGDSAGTVFYAAVALVLGLSARRDIRGDPGRRGIGLARAGIACSVAGALLLAGSTAQSGPPAVPQDPLAAAGTPAGSDRGRISAAGPGGAGTPTPTLAGDVRGTWSGTLGDDAGSGASEAVRLEIRSLDGLQDGTITTVNSGVTCNLVLAHQASRDGAELFTGSDPGGNCAQISLGVQIDPATGGLFAREQWQQQDGTTASFSGLLPPG